MKSLPPFVPPRRSIDDRGTLVCLEAGIHIPFNVQSVVYICDVPADVRRGGHAHYDLHQFIKCASGSVTVSTLSERGSTEIVLSQDSDGLYIPPITWAEQFDHAPGTVVLVMSSEHYDESDYIRNRETFTALLASNQAEMGTAAELHGAHEEL